jgi:hypothetical protein
MTTSKAMPTRGLTRLSVGIVALPIQAAIAAFVAIFAAFVPAIAEAQERPPWQQPLTSRSAGAADTYVPPASGGDGGQNVYSGQGYGTPYHDEPYERDYRPPPEQADDRVSPPGRSGEVTPDGTYSRNEILATGHRFFGSVSQGLASVVEYAFRKAGRPNGYILGEDAGGAFIAGLRYGEGVLYTKDAGRHKVYWQGPSLGYDFGGEGSKTMVLVYNLRHPSEIYNRYGGVQGSAYFVGGVGVQFQAYGHVVLAPIRSGVGLRLGANVGYLKYTRTPTWNPF